MFRPLPGTAVEVDDPQEVLQLFGVGGARVLLDGVFPVPARLKGCEIGIIP